MMGATGNPLDTILQMLKGQPGGVPPVLGKVLDPSQQVQSSAPQQAPSPQQASQPDPSQIPPQPDMSQMGTGIRPGSQALPDNVQPPPAPQQTKAHKLLQILQGGLVGGLSGLAANAQTYAQTGRNAGFGGGVGAGFLQSLPFMQKLQGQELQRGGLENQLLKSNVENQPLLMRMGLYKSQSEINKNQAEAGKDTAEAGAVPTKQKLEEAQTLAAQWKEEPATGLLRNLTTGETMDPGQGGMAILDAASAAVIGKQPGDKVPMKIALQAKQFVDAGVKPVQAGGRSLLVDSSGRKIADLGTATPVVVNNMNNPFANTPDIGARVGEAALQGMTPQQQALIKGVANYTIDPNSVVTARSGGKAKLLAAVKQFDPTYDEKKYGVIGGVQKDFTSGADAGTLAAFNTAIIHMRTFRDVADALDNGDTLLANQIGQAVGTQFGGNKATDFNIAKSAFAGEVGKAFAGANVAEGDRKDLSDKISAASSPGQLKGYADTAEKLLRGKRDVLKGKFNAGMQGNPNFGSDNAAPAGASHAVVVNGQVVGYSSDGKTMTPVGPVQGRLQ